MCTWASRVMRIRFNWGGEGGRSHGKICLSHVLGNFPFPSPVPHPPPFIAFGPDIGGSVWNAPASDGLGIFFTTGNTRNWSNTVTPSSYPCSNATGGPGVTCLGPNPHYGLSTVRTDYLGNVKGIFSRYRSLSTTTLIGMRGRLSCRPTNALAANSANRSRPS
jgi:hypothetical protein